MLSNGFCRLCVCMCVSAVDLNRLPLLEVEIHGWRALQPAVRAARDLQV
jgi:hypothetical protein